MCLCHHAGLSPAGPPSGSPSPFSPFPPRLVHRILVLYCLGPTDSYINPLAWPHQRQEIVPDLSPFRALRASVLFRLLDDKPSSCAVVSLANLDFSLASILFLRNSLSLVLTVSEGRPLFSFPSLLPNSQAWNNHLRYNVSLFQYQQDLSSDGVSFSYQKLANVAVTSQHTGYHHSFQPRPSASGFTFCAINTLPFHGSLPSLRGRRLHTHFFILYRGLL
jgi:hypothetical protein